MAIDFVRAIRSARTVLTIGLVVATAACGGGTTSDSASGDGDPAAPAASPASSPASAPLAGLTAMGAGSDACSRLSAADVTAAVGNPVLPGQPDAGPNTCKYDTQNPEDVNVLLILNPPGSIREQVLCPELKKAAPLGDSLPGVGDVATWKFSSMSLFNSGDLEACGKAGFVSLSLNGKRDEAALKAGATTLARKIFQ